MSEWRKNWLPSLLGLATSLLIIAVVVVLHEPEPEVDIKAMAKERKPAPGLLQTPTPSPAVAGDQVSAATTWVDVVVGSLSIAPGQKKDLSEILRTLSRQRDELETYLYKSLVEIADVASASESYQPPFKFRSRAMKTLLEKSEAARNEQDLLLRRHPILGKPFVVLYRRMEQGILSTLLVLDEPNGPLFRQQLAWIKVSLDLFKLQMHTPVKAFQSFEKAPISQVPLKNIAQKNFLLASGKYRALLGVYVQELKWLIEEVQKTTRESDIKVLRDSGQASREKRRAARNKLTVYEGLEMPEIQEILGLLDTMESRYDQARTTILFRYTKEVPDLQETGELLSEAFSRYSQILREEEAKLMPTPTASPLPTPTALTADDIFSDTEIISATGPLENASE